MEWKWHRWHVETAREAAKDRQPLPKLRLFPIVGPDLCYPVAAALAGGRLEDAAALVPDRAWVASTPLYG